jgi:hypothetical protein
MGCESLAGPGPTLQIFRHFVLAPGAVANPVASITAGTPEALSLHCDLEGGVPFENAPVTLGAVRLILLRSGFDAQTIAAPTHPGGANAAGKGRPVYKTARPQ